jgi:lysozyme
MNWFTPTPGTNTAKTHPVTKGVAWLVVAVTVVSGFEGFVPKAKKDIVGVPTVCYGATAADHVDLSKVYTKQECQQMLGQDLLKYDAQIQKCITPKVYAALPPNRHAALVSLDYNVGPGAFCKSSVVRQLNAGNVTAACNDFLLYDRAGGKVVQGLVNRRKAEQKLCLSNS